MPYYRYAVVQTYLTFWANQSTATIQELSMKSILFMKFCSLYYICFILLKVGVSPMAISEPWAWINGQFQSLHNFHSVKLLLLLEITLNSILRPSNWKFELSPRPHLYSDPIIRTGQKTMDGIIYHGIHWGQTYRSNLFHTEKQGIGYPWFKKKKNSTHTH